MAVLQASFAADVEGLEGVLDLNREHLLEGADVVAAELVLQVFRTRDQYARSSRGKTGRAAGKDRRHRREEHQRAKDQGNQTEGVLAEERPLGHGAIGQVRAD